MDSMGNGLLPRLQNGTEATFYISPWAGGLLVTASPREAERGPFSSFGTI